MHKSREQMEIETDAAKSVDILYVANQFGIELKKCGTCYQDKSDKGLVFFPRTNSFFDYYQNVGGSTIDFVIYMNGGDIRSAVNYLNELMGNDISYEPSVNRMDNNRKNTGENGGEFVLPPANDNYKRVFAYLVNTRCIAPSVVSNLMHDKRLYETADKHNAAFVAYDKDNNPQHVFLRGTISDKVWRGDVLGSNKNYGFSIPGKNDELVVFEAPIDALSYLSLSMNKENTSHLLALGMLSPEPIDTYLSEHPEIKTIAFALDADTPGLAAAKKFIESYKEKGFNCGYAKIVAAMMQSKCKDVNDYLKLQVKKKKGEELNRENRDKKHTR